MPAHAAARHRGSIGHGGVPHPGGAGRHADARSRRYGAHLPPPPLADPAELIGIPPGRTAYRLETVPGGRHRADLRFGRSRAVIGGVAGMTVTAVTVKVGAAAAVSSLVLSIQHLVR